MREIIADDRLRYVCLYVCVHVDHIFGPPLGGEGSHATHKSKAGQLTGNSAIPT